MTRTQMMTLTCMALAMGVTGAAYASGSGERLSMEARQLQIQALQARVDVGLTNAIARVVSEADSLAICERSYRIDCSMEASVVVNDYAQLEVRLESRARRNSGLAIELDRMRMAISDVQYEHAAYPGAGGISPYPGMGRVVATGRLNMVTFNLVGYGQIDIERQCLQVAAAGRLTEVKLIEVNGQTMTRGVAGYSVSEACDLVASLAAQNGIGMGPVAPVPRMPAPRPAPRLPRRP